MPRLFKRSHRYNVAKNTLLAKIILLDNTTIDFNPLPEVTGEDCLEKVAQTLDIQEVRRRQRWRIGGRGKSESKRRRERMREEDEAERAVWILGERREVEKGRKWGE